MKTIKYLIIALIALCPLTLNAGIETEVKRVNLTIHMYNPWDVPPALPVMSIVFSALPEANADAMSNMQKEITEAISKASGIVSEKDYKEKLGKIVEDYAVRMIESKAMSINILFPRKKQGILLFNQKRK